MASALTTEEILSNARNTTVKEFDVFCDNILKTTKDVENLKQLYLFMHSTRLNRKLPNDVAYALLAMICDSTISSSTSQLLCCLILQESSPLKSLQLDETLLSIEDKSISHLMQILLVQTRDIWTNENVVTKILKCVKDRDLSQVFAFVNHMSTSIKFVFTSDQVDCINRYLSEILCYTSSFQAPNPNSNKLFRRSEQKLHVTEIDGVESREYFTILNLAQYYSDDHIANFSAFSTLQSWLYANLAHFGNSDSSNIPSSMNPLLSSIRNYCVRLTEQCERRALRKEDSILQDMCVLECVRLLDLVCTLNPSQTTSIFGTIKRIQSNYVGMSTRNVEKDVISVALVEFTLHHGHQFAYDYTSILESILKGVIANNYHNITIAFEIVQFLLNNLKSLSEKDSLLIRYFPHIFRLLAWHPRTFYEDFLHILPSFVAPSVTVEVFHAILDLPCLAAALVYTQSQSLTEIPTWSQNFTVQPYKPMFAFMLRCNSGIGDTFNGLEQFHELILHLSANSHVTNCADLVPTFLKNFFKIILSSTETQHLIRLIPAILERVRLILNIPGYISNIQTVLADNILLLYKLRPNLVLEAMADLLDFISNSRNFEKCPQFYVHCVWIIGEFTSTNHVTDCTPKVITSYYDVLECVIHEVLTEFECHSLQSQLVTTLSMTLAKLSTRSQDLLARAALTLTKIGKQMSQNEFGVNSEKEIVFYRVTQLLALLQVPLVASSVLNPPIEFLYGKNHCECVSLPVVLKTLSQAEC